MEFLYPIMHFFVLSLEPGPSMYYVSTFWIFLTPSFPMSALLCWKLLFLELYSKSEIFLSCLKIYFKTGPWRVVPCGCIQVYHVVRLNTIFNTCTLHHSMGSMFEMYFETGQTFFRFKWNFRILKVYLRFQINSNEFLRYRTFGQ